MTVYTISTKLVKGEKWVVADSHNAAAAAWVRVYTGLPSDRVTALRITTGSDDSDGLFQGYVDTHTKIGPRIFVCAVTSDI